MSLNLKSKFRQMKKTYTLLALILLGEILGAQIIAHYTFSNGAMIDQSTLGNYATNYGASPFDDMDLNENEAVIFGANDYVGLPDGILLHPQLSVSLWFKTSSSGVILGTQNQEALDVNGVSNTYLPIIYIDSQNILRAGFWSGISRSLISNTNYADNKWHHLVLIADNSRQYLYVDNQQVASEFYQRNVLSTLIHAQLGVGKVLNWPNSGNDAWLDFDGGLIDNVRIYSSALTPYEVTTIYNSEKLGPQSINLNLVALYTFESGTLIDKSHNNNDATNSGSIPSADIDNNQNQAISFGENNYIRLPNSLLSQQNISVSLWFKTSTEGAILGYQNASPSNFASSHVPIIYIGHDKVLRAAFWSGATRSLSSTIDYADDQWHHLVLTANSSNQSLFIDNQLINTSNYGHVVNTGLAFAQLGAGNVYWAWPGNGGETWMDFEGGNLDNVRVYHGTLSSSTVNLIYQHEKGQDLTTGVNSLKKQNQLLVYPNPASSQVRTQIGEIEIYTLEGKMVYSDFSTGVIDISSFKPGIYIVSQNNQTQKLIIK